MNRATAYLPYNEVSLSDVTRSLAAATRNRRLMTAALALHNNRLSEAEPLLKAHLHEQPFDFAAIRMLAELAGRIGRMNDAEHLLRRALEIAPSFGPARTNLATLLYRTNRPIEALAALDELRTEDHESAKGSNNLRAAVLNRVGEFDEALALYATELTRDPNQPRVWVSYGHVLKTVGRLAEGIAAYRQAVEQLPYYGDAWWSLANLKTVRLDADDQHKMAAELARIDLAAENRYHLEFALGKAAEDAKDPSLAFGFYTAANAHRRAKLPYEAATTTRAVNRMIETFSAEYFETLVKACPAPDPIFILGMPRAGSTLVEQILASHSLVEGVMELPDIPMLWAGLGDKPHARLSAMTRAERIALGEQYLTRVAPQRRTDRPFFIDKLPNNWLFIGFIKAILPNAKIIDARRHPLSCGFSNFKQHYARGHAFSYDLSDIGSYYVDYVRMLAHFDVVLPGAVHRVIYEHMVEDSNAEIRALLAALHLPFETACLAFHETERAVRTPSSEQVRAPIFRSGIEGWQAYDQWLGPLKNALGQVLATYPRPPIFNDFTVANLP